MWPVTPSSKPNFENKRNEAAKRSLRCRRSSATLANLGGPGKPGFFTGAVAMCTSKTKPGKLFARSIALRGTAESSRVARQESAPEDRVTQMNAGGELMAGRSEPLIYT